MTIIDTHQHFWIYNAEAYAWITPAMQRIRRSFLPDDLGQIVKRAKLSGTIAVQACHSLEETSMLLSFARENEFIKGVVGWVDLCDPMVERQLEQLASNEKFVGIRHVLQGEPDDAYMLRKEFMNGIRLLGKYHLTYDILIFPRHLPAACLLVKEFPDQPFVVDHMAKPPIKDGKLDLWRADIRKLATFPNVHCKVSGMITEADWTGWSAETFSPYLDVVFGAFGEDRVMYGSDWPVCLVAANAYEDVLDVSQSYLKGVSLNILDKFFGKNGKSFYDLKD